ncbi:MAG: protein-L-isoaspartate(D-aspartate) O-methyltransferase [Calditrichaeota bacterium]|nr:protein-L-isoaspartate(D-aspartate) O-methyltransferase [Calditrichota bacterium]MCB9366515.1 protein-L-isoaspartate(D-aspartate) O-methyltransferase [Calditrichota bacterium]MCB9391227.1 protein-L-isoaspartate(D-aspartate) O-methyltransferase [Calditrichota bacterium]
MRNYKLTRDEMVLTQLRRRGIEDDRVLEAMTAVKRHEFVNEAFQNRAYEDTPLPIELGQTISQPFIVARMTELLQVRPTDKILEIGTGSGYQAAVLSRLAAKVFTIERHFELAKTARARLEASGYTNVIVKHGDGTIGWSEHAPFDKVLITASAPQLPKTLSLQLKEGGRMIFPMGADREQKLMVADKIDGELQIQDKGTVSFVPLIGREGFSDPGADPRQYMSGRSAVR